MQLNFSEDTETLDENMVQDNSSGYEDEDIQMDSNGYDYSDEEENPQDDNFDEGYDYNKIQKLKKTAIGVASGIVGLVVVALVMTMAVLSKQSAQERNIKDWVKEYLAEAYSDELTEEQLDEIAAQTGFLLSDALGAEDLDFTSLTDDQIAEIVEKIREPLITTLTDEEATVMSEQLITKYFEKLEAEGKTLPGQATDSKQISDILSRINDLEYADTALKSSITSVASQQGKQGVQGIQGVQGATGATGAKGDRGEKGDKGDTGASGVDGRDGSDGTSSYIFYATDSNGANASLTPTDDSLYMKSIQATSESAARSALSSDTSAWVEFKSSGGVTATYDASNNTVTFTTN